MPLKEDDVVMCTVLRIEGTTVFLTIDGNGEGSMMMSEVAAGRIRNLREYVTPNKKVVCKVLKIINGHPQLSLRRVTGKERERVQDMFKKERALSVLLRTVRQDVAPLLSALREEHELGKFYDDVRENPSLLAKYLSKSEMDKMLIALAERKESEKVARSSFLLKSYADEGLVELQQVLSSVEGVDIRYLGSSVFSLSAPGKDFKEAHQKVEEAIALIEKVAKEKKLIFEAKSS